MLARQLPSGHCTSHQLFLDRTQVVVLLAPQAYQSRRCRNSPALTRWSRGIVNCRFTVGSAKDRSAPGGPLLPASASGEASLDNAKATAASTSPLAVKQIRTSSESEDLRAPKVTTNLKPVFAALWRPTAKDDSEAEQPALRAFGSRATLDLPPHGGAVDAAAAASPAPSVSERSTLPVPTARQKTQRRSRDRSPSSPAALDLYTTSTSVREADDNGCSHPGPFGSDVGAFGGYISLSQAQRGDGSACRNGADLSGLDWGTLPSLEPSSASQLDSLVASALAFDEGAFQRPAWGDSNWDLASETPLDAAAAVAEPRSSRRSSNSLGAAATCGRRGRRRRGSGNDLDDEEDAWDFGTYLYQDGGLDAAQWGIREEDFGAAGAFGGSAHGGGGGGLGGGGKRGAIRSESKLRKALAAASTRLPRIGLSVAFPLPPVPDVAAETAAMTAVATAAATAAAATPAATAAGNSSDAEKANTAAVIAAAAHSGGKDAGVGVAAAAAAAGPKPNDGAPSWATVPLSYNFGPCFKLLEESDLSREVPLPEDLLHLAGNLSGGGGGGGGGRSAVDVVLPGCTAYSIAGDYQVLLVQDARSVDVAVSWLRRSVGEDRVVGIDAEWPPAFRREAPQQLAMLQLATPSRVVLLHIARMKRKATAPDGPIHALLSDPTLTWVGSGWDSADRPVMADAFGGAALPPAVLDVQAAARAAGWPRVGLRGLVNDVLGVQEFQKPRRLSMCNWAAPYISDKQVRYAALDALLPPLLLRQLRLFASMPRLRCSFCKQAMHAPRGRASPAPSAPPVASTGLPPAPLCDHCGRAIPAAPHQHPAEGDGNCSNSSSSNDDAVGGAVAMSEALHDADPRVGHFTCSSPAPARAGSRSGSSLRDYLMGVVEGRNPHQQAKGPQGRRQRQLLFPCDSGGRDEGSGPGSRPCSESDYGSDVESGSASGTEDGDVGSQCVAAAALGTSKGKGKNKGKGKSKGKGKAKNERPSASRQKALWEAFEEASPAAAAAVALAMAGQGHSGLEMGTEAAAGGA